MIIHFGAPGPIIIDPNQQSIHSNSTINASDSRVYSGFGTKEISLLVNVKNAPTGTLPTLQFTVQEVDPGDGTTVFGSSVSTVVINAVGVYRATFRATYGGHLKVSWVVGGSAGPTFTGVYSTLTAKATSVSAGLDPTGVERSALMDTSGRFDQNVGSWMGSAAPTVGQKAMTASVPVTISSDQTAIPVSVSPSNAANGLAYGNVTVAVAATTAAVRDTTYTEQTANFQGSIRSSVAADTALGTGARTVKITYLAQDYTGPFTETVTLNGTTWVNLVSLDHCYIEDIEVMTVGTGLVNAGTITLVTGLAGAGTTVGSIAIGANLAYWAHHYVPTGKTGNVTGVNFGSSSSIAGGGSVFQLRAKQLGVANAVEKPITEQLRKSVV